MRLIFRSALVVTIAVLSLFALQSRVHAAPPLIQRFDISRTQVTHICGPAFPVTISRTGIVKVETFFDQSGNPTRVHISVSAAFLSISGNGVTLTSATPFPETIDLSTGTDTRVGLEFHVVVPGQGIILAYVGRVVFDAQGNITFEAGQFPDNYFEDDTPLICSVLSAGPR